MKIAHRGASGCLPENTLEAIDKAVQMGADMVEVDIHVIKSGEVVVFHDETLDRLTTQKGHIKSYTWEALKHIKVQDQFAIPSLEDVLKLLHNRCKLNIEIKFTGSYKSVQETIAKSHWSYGDLEVASFDCQELQSYKHLCPEMPICVLVEDALSVEDSISFAKHINATSINMQHQLLNKALVSEIHKLGLQTSAWTINNHEDIQRAIGVGVDGIVSDYIDRIL